MMFFSSCGSPALETIPGRKGIEMTDGNTVFLKEIDSEEFFAANFFVSANGAKANGKSDDTAAIQKTLDKAGQAGGGTVYIPCGSYKITAPLHIPDQVTLKGDFTSPTAKNPTGAKTRLILADTEALRQSPAITLGNRAGISGLSIQYQAQNTNEIREYPFTIAQNGTEAVSLTDLELVNSYRAILLGEESCDSALLENLYITALQTGIQIDRCSGLLRMEKIKISPKYWSNKPKDKKENYDANSVSDFLTENLTAMAFGDIADAQLYNIEIDTARKGIAANIPQQSPGLLSVTSLFTANNVEVFSVESLGQGGMAVNLSDLRSTGLMDSSIVRAGENFKTQICFNTCTFPNRTYECFVSAGTGDMSFANCTVSSWRKGAFHLTDGVVAAMNNTFSNQEIVGVFENPALGVFYNNRFASDPYANADYFFAQSSQEEIALTPQKTEDFSFLDRTAPAAASAVYAKDFGLSADAESNNAALQSAIDSLGAKGGVVLIQEGEYYFDPEAVQLKPNVALCGVGQGNGSAYATVFSFRNADAEKSAAILAEKGSQITGIKLVCQSAEDMDGYPDYAVRVGRDSSGFRLKNTEISGFGGGIYLENHTGAMIKNCTAQVSQFGVAAINSSDILIKNCNFLPQDGQNPNTQTAIYSYGGENLRMFSNSVSLAQTGLSLSGQTTSNSGKPTAAAAGLFLSGVESAVTIENTTTALLSNLHITLKAQAGSCLTTEKSNSGTVVVANTVFSGEEGEKTYWAMNAGKAEIQTSVFRSPVSAAFTVSGGNLSVGANLFYSVPENHIAADGGHILFTGNLIESAKDFAAIEGDYVTEDLSGSAETTLACNSKRCDIPKNLTVEEIQ